jgi:hypothetical protein
MIGSLVAALLVPVSVSAQAYDAPSPADISTNIANARAQIARYRAAPPRTGGERCYELKQIVRSLRAGQKTDALATWQQHMRHTCLAARKSPDL